jgi:hypothetical protein
VVPLGYRLVQSRSHLTASHGSLRVHLFDTNKISFIRDLEIWGKVQQVYLPGICFASPLSFKQCVFSVRCYQLCSGPGKCGLGGCTRAALTVGR